MRTRLRTLGAGGVQARTFHAAALRQLSYFWPKVVGGAPPRIAEAKAQLVAEAARRVGLPADRTGVRDLAAEVEWAKVSLVVPDEYAVAAAAVDRVVPGGHDASAVARLMTAYEQVKDERGVIDFEDVLLLLAAMLAERADVGDQVRGQYRHFVVDEYQDVSPLQRYLLDQWLGGRRELCVVGDPSQTIYSFAGATPHHLLSFTRVHPEAQVVRLVRDYRSTPRWSSSPTGSSSRAPRSGAGARRSSCVHSVRTGRRCAGRRTPTTRRRPPGSRPRRLGSSRTACPPVRSRCCTAPTRRARRSRRRCRQRASRTRCGAASGSSRAATSGRPSSTCAVARVPRTWTCRCPRPRATCCATRAGPTRRPRRGVPHVSGGRR